MSLPEQGVLPIQRAPAISTVGSVDPFPDRAACIDPLPDDGDDDDTADAGDTGDTDTNEADEPDPPTDDRAGTARGSPDVADGADPYRR